MNVCQRNVAHFWSRGCRFDKINDIFQGFGDWSHCDFREMEALKVNNLDEPIALEHRAVQARCANLYPSVRLVKT